MNKKREVIKTKDVDGKSIEIAVIVPGHKINQEANMFYSLKVSQLIRQGVENGERLLLRSEVDDYLIKSKIWTNEDVVKMEQLGLTIKAIELTLKKGGMQKWEARQLAIKMGDLRNQMTQMFNRRQQLDSSTVEATAENYKFAMTMVMCTVYADTGKPFFKDYEDYLEKGEEIASIDAAKFLSKFIYGLTDEVNTSFFENKWLQEAGYINDQGRYTDEKGKLIDKDGNTVDQFGRCVDKDGDLVNKQGIKIDSSGEFVVEDFKPFINKDGKEEFICQTKLNKNKKSNNKKKTKRKKKSKATVKK